MAKKSRGDKKLSAAQALINDPNAMAVLSDPNVGDPAVQNALATQETKKMQITLTKRNVEKSGNVAYAQAGVKASVYFNKNMFAPGAALPSTITIGVDGDVNPFAQPGQAVATPLSKMTKEERIANLAKAREARAHETPDQKAQRLLAKSAKLQKQAAKLSAQATAAAPAAPAAGTTEQPSA